MIPLRKHSRQLASAGGLALIVLALSACAPAAPTQAPTEAGGAEAIVAPYGSVAEATGEPVEADLAEAPTEAVTEAANIESPPSASNEDSSTGSEDQPIAFEQQPSRMIIKNGDIALLVSSLNIAVDQVTQIAVDNGGYVLTSQIWSDDNTNSATMTIAVRAENFEIAMRRLRETALQVLQESSSGEDVSAEFVDLQSRLTNLEATRDRIKTFLEQAKNVDEALKVNKQLADIEAEIEQVKGRMNFLKGRAAYSTITVNLSTPQPTPTVTFTPSPTPTRTPTATPTATNTPTPFTIGPVVDSAMKTQTSALQGFATVAVWFSLVFGPYLIVIALIAIGVQTYRRRNGYAVRTTPPPTDQSEAK